MTRQIRLGVLVPSSNTALEPITTSIISTINNASRSSIFISVHFSRFRVTDISLSHASSSQFDLPTILSAASLLADAQVDAIGWSGTSAGWLGFETDERLCSAITEKFGIPATTSTLGLNQILSHLGTKQLGLVTPYSSEMNASIRANYRTIGVHIPETQTMNLGTSNNHVIAAIDDQTLTKLVQDVKAQTGVSVITTFCTNLKSAPLVKGWESDKLTVLDSVATVVWSLLKVVDVDTRLVKGWGQMFDIA